MNYAALKKRLIPLIPEYKTGNWDRMARLFWKIEFKIREQERGRIERT